VLLTELDGVGARALVLVAVVLRVAFDGVEGALVEVAARGGGLAKRAQSGAANKGAVVCGALDLLDLEGRLDVCVLKVLLAHEGRHELAVVLAGESAEHSHDGKLVIQHGNGEGLRAQLLNASEGLRGTTGNGLEQHVWLLDDGEEGVVSAKAHAGDLLAVDLEQLAPHGGRIPLVRADKRTLGGGKVGVDVASGLLLSNVDTRVSV
jgi:hypothetical protein